MFVLADNQRDLTMTMIAEKYSAKVVNLCKALRKGPAAIDSLPTDLASDEVLGAAFVDGLVEVGRQAYTLVPINSGDGSSGKIKRDRAGKIEVDEYKRPILEKQYTVSVENEWSWMDRSQRHRAPLADVLEEKTQSGVPALHARLTSAGLAACN